MKKFLVLIVLVCFSPSIFTKELNCFLGTKNINSKIQGFTEDGKFVEWYDTLKIDNLNEDYDLNLHILEDKNNNLIIQKQKYISDFNTKLYPLVQFPDENILIYLIILGVLKDHNNDSLNPQLSLLEISEIIKSNNFTYDDVLKNIEYIYQKDFNLKYEGNNNLGPYGILSTSLDLAKILLEDYSNEQIVQYFKQIMDVYDNDLKKWKQGITFNDPIYLNLDNKDIASTCYNMMSEDKFLNTSIATSEIKLCLQENNSDNLKMNNIYETFKDKKINDYSYLINYSLNQNYSIHKDEGFLRGEHNRILERFYYGFCE